MRYQIILKGKTLGRVTAENATEALNAFCEKRPNAEVGFQAGGLEYDAATRGMEWASVNTLAGRLIAEASE